MIRRNTIGTLDEKAAITKGEPPVINVAAQGTGNRWGEQPLSPGRSESARCLMSLSRSPNDPAPSNCTTTVVPLSPLPEEGVTARALAILKSPSRLRPPVPLRRRRHRSSETNRNDSATTTYPNAGLSGSSDEVTLTSSSHTNSSTSSCYTSTEESDQESFYSETANSGSASESEEDYLNGEVTDIRERRMYRKRRYIAQEIITTEVAYVEHLRDMVELLYRPMELAVKSPSESELLHRIRSAGHIRHGELPTMDDLKEVFSHLVSILELNAEFLRKLERVQIHIDCHNDLELQVGDAFLSVIDSFKFYSAFVNTYQSGCEALSRIQETRVFKTIVKEAEAQGHRLCVNSLMVTPIQRIPRYLLLLKDLLNHTPSNHPDHPKLCIVLPKMEEVANYINNEKSKFDDITTILNLSQVISGYDDSFIKPGRKFIKEGYLKILNAETMKSKRRYFFLFSDVLLITRAKRGSLFAKGQCRYQFKKSVQMLHASVESLPNIETFPNGFQISQGDAVHMLLGKDKEDREVWIEAIQSAIESVNTTSKVRPHSLPALSLADLMPDALDQSVSFSTSTLTAQQHLRKRSPSLDSSKSSSRGRSRRSASILSSSKSAPPSTCTSSCTTPSTSGAFSATSSSSSSSSSYTPLSSPHSSPASPRTASLLHSAFSIFNRSKSADSKHTTVSESFVSIPVVSSTESSELASISEDPMHSSAPDVSVLLADEKIEDKQTEQKNRIRSLSKLSASLN